MDMDDLAAPHVSTEDHVVKGWSALERHDLAAARAVLQNLYDLDPRHPALPLLAAGIRRIRPKPIRWRAGVLLLAAIGVGLIAVRARNGQSRETAPNSAQASAVTRPAPSPAPPAH